MYRGLVGADGSQKESDLTKIFEEPHFSTFGAAYEKRPRYSAGAYSSLVKRLETFLDKPIEEGIKIRDARADKLLAFDDEVVKVVAALKEKGLESPYLKNYVVARVNFLRFKKDGVFDFDETIDKLTASVKKIDPSGVRKEDLAKMGGAPAEGGDE
jgi:ParB family transcriptional regulator, chromosome partitioning protein